MIPKWLIGIFEAEYFVLTAEFVIFTIGYAWLTRGDWRRSTAGQILMALSGSCSIILGLSILRIFLPEHAWRIYASALAVAGLVVVAGWLNILMFMRQVPLRRAWKRDQDKQEQADRERQIS